jgi:hypothetical protein
VHSLTGAGIAGCGRKLKDVGTGIQLNLPELMSSTKQSQIDISVLVLEVMQRAAVIYLPASMRQVLSSLN